MKDEELTRGRGDTEKREPFAIDLRVTASPRLRVRSSAFILY